MRHVQEVFNKRMERYMKRLFLLSLLVGLCTMCASLPLPAQFTLSIAIRTPTPPSLAEWRRDATIVRVTLLNTTPAEYRDVRLSFFIRNVETGEVIVRTKDNDARMPRFTVRPLSSLMLNGPDIINQQALDVDPSIQTQSVTTGMLPEGTYEYCVDALAPDGTSLSSTGQACAIFRVFIPDPPELIYPVGESIESVPYPMFRWSPVTLPGTTVRYHIVVAAMLEGQTPRDAIERNGPSNVLVDRDAPTNSYSYQPADRPFADFTSRGITHFAWQVQALNADGTPATRNNGKSEFGEFWLGSGSGGTGLGSMTLEPYYPYNNDTIPWQPPHLIVRWGAYDDAITRMAYTLVVRNASGAEIGRNTRTLNWSSGILESQGVFTVDRARLIIVNFTDACLLPGWMQSLPRGQRFSWTVEARFTRNDGSTETLASRPSTFTMGLRLPENRSPEQDTVFAAGSDVTLRWATPPPAQLNFEPTDILTRHRTESCMQFTPAFEVVRVEVSRFSDFRTLVARDSTPLPRGAANYVTGDNTPDFFAPQSHALGALSDTGTYYWRVSYLNDRSATAYLTGPVWRFRIGADGTGGDITGTECIRLLPASPEPNGRWTAGTQPRFSVLARPLITTSAITGGRLQVWEMNSASEDSNAVIRRTPVFDQSFSGNTERSIRARSVMGSTTLPLDLSFVNESGSPQTFTATTGKSYLWRFTLTFNGSSIRRDGTPCSVSERATRLAMFTVPDTSSACPDICSTSLPTDRTPATRTFAVGDTLQIGRFRLGLTSVSGSASSLSGQGVVRIPFLNSAGINVEFSGLSVNQAGQVYEGEVNARQEATSPLSQADANRLTGALGMNESQIQSVQTLVSQTERLVSGLALGTPMSLPIGFDNVIDGERMVIAVIGIVFRPTDARLNAAMSVEIPAFGPGAGLGLAARDVCFHPNGFGGDGRVKLCLAIDHGFREPDTWSFMFKAASESDSGTCVMLDCHGFQWLRIHAEAEFPRTWFTKVPATDTSLVTATFMATIHRTGDFIVSATMDPFAPAGAPDFHMAVQDLVLDMSEVDNYPAMVFPPNYRGDQTARWKGFYLGRIAMSLPDELRTFDSTQPPQIEIANVLIDRTGLSFDARAVNVIQYPRGNFGEWGASIDTIGIAFLNGSLQAGYLRGRFQIPISDSALYYSATLSQSTESSGLEFSFSIVPRDTINARLWVAKLSLNPTSRIELTANGSGVRASATLSGGLSIEADAGGVPGLNFRGITFENVRLMTNEPYFERGTWSFASPQHSAAGFPVSISNLGIVTGTRDRGLGAGVQFTLSVNLQPGNNAISGGTTLSVWGVMPTGSTPARFEFDGVDLDSIGVRADMGAVVIAGGVRLYRRDPTFGSGFRGGVTASFLQQIEVTATVQFGSVDDYRYWYVDARALMSAGIPIFSGVGIYGFGGGAWHHMRREAINPTQEQAMLASAPDGASARPNSDTSNPGSTNSGYRFVPDRGTEFGFRAMVTLGTHPSPDAFNGDVAFEMEFLSGGGIGRITIEGAAYIMASPSNRSEAKVTATAEITYNFPEKTFNGLFDIRINASPLTGGGQIAIHFSPRTWFIKAGEPPRDKRIYVSLASWININTYLMVGKNLPNPMGLPPEIERVLGPLPAVRMPQIENADGFAFGAEANFDTGRLQFLIFYARLALTLGFDVALLNMGPAARCQGSGGPMGIDGWYAMGQLYAYIRGSIGIYVDLWFVSGEFEILGAEVAAALQAGLPNPTWLTGAVAGSYRILGGAISGSCRFEFKMGDECLPITENPIAKLDLISDIQPPNGSEDIPFDVEPQAAFNFTLNRPFELSDYDSRGNTYVRTFRIKVQDFSLKTDAGSTVASTWRATRDSVQAVLTPTRPLNGQAWYRASITAFGEEYKSRRWEAARKNDGSVITQTVTTRFRTAQPPDTVIPSNIAMAYPRDRQRFFLQDECPTGSIDLHASQGYLFTSGNETVRYTYHARFVPLPAGTPPVETPIRYIDAGRRGYISYEMPTLQNNTIYALQIVRRSERIQNNSNNLPMLRQDIQTGLPQLRYGNLTRNTTLQSVLRTYRSGLSTLVQSDRRVTGFELSRQIPANENLLLIYYFRTSTYNNLDSKLKMLSFTETGTPAPLGNFRLLEPAMTGPELFDTWDITGQRYEYHGTTYQIQPLVVADAAARQDRWHTAFTNPWIYDILNMVEQYRSRNISTYFERGIMQRTLLQYDGGERNLLTDYEISPPPPSPGSTISSNNWLQNNDRYNLGGRIASVPGITSSVKFSYQHGIAVLLDYTLMRNQVAALLACCSGEFMNPADERKFRTALSRAYEPMYRGNYRTYFWYNYCIDPDIPATRYQENFNY